MPARGVSGVEWNIRPYEGAGPVDFNMTTSRIKEVLGRPPYEHQREPERKLEWLYNDFDITLTFDADLRCDFIGFLPGSVGIVKDIRLVGQYEEVVEQLERRGYTLREQQLLTRIGDIWSGHTVCDDLGISFRRETKRQEHISDSTAFRRGYWEAARSAMEEQIRSEQEGTSR